MAIYQTPGVYREDVFPARPSTLPTGVPAFLGQISRRNGEVNEPVRLTRFSQLAEIFDAPPAGRYLAAAVEGFFLNGGTECLIVPLGNYFPTDPEKALKDGLTTLATQQGFDLVCIPDLYAVAQDDQALRMQIAILRHCHAEGDRFALLDPAPRSVVSDVLTQREKLGDEGGDFGGEGALYYPWLQPAGTTRCVPPCGHIAGVVARCDQAIGVHKAPANEILEGVIDLSVRLTDADQGLLNPEGINAVRAFPGRGIRIWGARTLSRTPTWTYVNVRRLFLTVTRWIEVNLAGVAFEHHDIRLWSRITRELTAYLAELFKTGALQGRTAAEAFFVQCDGTTNPPEVREMGQVVTVIGLAATVPNEFVVVRLVQGAGGVDIKT